MAEKRRWWIKLEYEFFHDKKTKSLRRKYGQEALIIYQKIMLRSLSTECCLQFDGLEDSFAEEVAETIDEDNIDLVENVLDYLLKHEMMVKKKNAKKEIYYFPQAALLSGSETDSAERMRNKRKRDGVSQSDGETSQCSVTITEQNSQLNQNYSDSKSYSSDSEQKEKQSKAEQGDVVNFDSDSVSAESAPSGGLDAPGVASSAVVCSLSEMIGRRDRYKIPLTDDGVKVFYSECVENDWTMYGKPVTNIARLMRAWAKYNEEYQLQDETAEDDDDAGDDAPWWDKEDDASDDDKIPSQYKGCKHTLLKAIEATVKYLPETNDNSNCLGKLKYYYPLYLTGERGDGEEMSSSDRREVAQNLCEAMDYLIKKPDFKNILRQNKFRDLGNWRDYLEKIAWGEESEMYLDDFLK